ncbi:hypothetical protein CDL15_Pgr007207 [Punica granatum]|nr:hypothetical protein CDL15_Pgr007207 [Punica granatum]
MVRRKVRTTFFLISTALFAFFYLLLHLRLSPFLAANASSSSSSSSSALDIDTDLGQGLRHLNLPRSFHDSADLQHFVVSEPEPNRTRVTSSISEDAAVEEPKAEEPKVEEPVAILFPDWEVFVVADPSSVSPGDELHCVFQNNATSPARFAGVLPFTNRTTFRCLLPPSVRRLRPFYQPLLTSFPRGPHPVRSHSPPPELFRWNFLAYESFSTEDDVVLFVKGVNNRQGINRPPSEFSCVFFNGEDPSAAVKTPVTSSIQEVFRCPHPKLRSPAEGVDGEKLAFKISLEIAREKLVVPSVAYYAPHRASSPRASKSLICACTMVYNVAKFLREWVTYHARVGVERFVLYDNGSEDDLAGAVEELNKDGYDVHTIMWPWPKTQEAGFSHSAVYHNDSCSWMMYVDVDEFVYVPSWDSQEQPSNKLIESSLLPQDSHGIRSRVIGQVSINCNEFGPSGQRSNPPDGVTQGYTCRRRVEQRHKSIVRLSAVDLSLLNVIHHFKLRQGYLSKQMGLNRALVNHYKYQAWPEFQTKFRRRVSAYVADWTQAVNPMSKDRTPGLGFEPIEPKDWADKFCEVRDKRLKLLIQKWFGAETESGYRMPW